MRFYTILLLTLLQRSFAQDPSCDYFQQVQPNQVYYIYSPNYNNSYPPGIQCRWQAQCPSGYNCRIECPDISLPYTDGCTMDRLLVSLTGDEQLIGAETYCGVGTYSGNSVQDRLSIGLITSTANQNGGRFICSLTAVPASGTSSCSCGYKRSNRIVGGQETGVNEFPMMTGLVDLPTARIFCGAVIISDQYLMTAGHCVLNYNLNDLGVIVGEHNINVADSPATQLYRVADVLVHPQFSTQTYDYDIALMMTATRIAFSDRVGPACLPFKFANTDFTNAKVEILGWGTTLPGGPTSDYLQKVTVDVMGNSACQAQVPTVTARQLCTYTPGKDACQDDSGGPLLYTDPATGLLFPVGIVSYGQLCASTTPGINTRVTQMLNWITSNTPDGNYCRK